MHLDKLKRFSADSLHDQYKKFPGEEDFINLLNKSKSAMSTKFEETKEPGDFNTYLRDMPQAAKDIREAAATIAKIHGQAGKDLDTGLGILREPDKILRETPVVPWNQNFPTWLGGGGGVTPKPPPRPLDFEDRWGGMKKYAKGGITTGPSIVGEGGPEVVIPLTGGNARKKFKTDAIDSIVSDQSILSVIGGLSDPESLISQVGLTSKITGGAKSNIDDVMSRMSQKRSDTAMRWGDMAIDKIFPGIRTPRMAEGGITSGPTLVGEAGPEAVIPLTGSKAWSTAPNDFVAPRGNPNVNPDVLSSYPRDAPTPGPPVPGEGAYLPASIRNNNPGAISRTTIWGGTRGSERPADEGTGPGDKNNYYTKFNTPEEGVNAQARLVMHYAAERDLDTAHDIIWGKGGKGGWAAKGQGPYVSDVTKSMGVGEYDKLNFNDPKVMAAWVKAAGRHEAGTTGFPYKDDVYTRGVNMAPPTPLPTSRPVQSFHGGGVSAAVGGDALRMEVSKPMKTSIIQPSVRSVHDAADRQHTRWSSSQAKQSERHSRQGNIGFQ